MAQMQQNYYHYIAQRKINNITLSRCGGAAVLPLAPLEPDSAWACDQCGLKLVAEDQQQTLCQALEVSRKLFISKLFI